MCNNFRVQFNKRSRSKSPERLGQFVASLDKASPSPIQSNPIQWGYLPLSFFTYLYIRNKGVVVRMFVRVRTCTSYLGGVIEV